MPRRFYGADIDAHDTVIRINENPTGLYYYFTLLCGCSVVRYYEMSDFAAASGVYPEDHPELTPIVGTRTTIRLQNAVNVLSGHSRQALK